MRPPRPARRHHPGADVRRFSFGTLKTATALGGALVWVRDRQVRDAMRAIQTTWLLQTSTATRTRRRVAS